MTPTEIFFAVDFATKMVQGNNDDRDFRESKNPKRTTKKQVEDMIKGKLAEMSVTNYIGKLGHTCEMDFNIYPKGTGDNFDVVANGKSIDVKASSPNANWLMVEKELLRKWKTANTFPDYLCMVGVEEKGSDWECTYMFGIRFKDFIKTAQLVKRGQNIPHTGTKLKADNYIVARADSGILVDFKYFMNGGENTPF